LAAGVPHDPRSKLALSLSEVYHDPITAYQGVHFGCTTAKFIFTKTFQETFFYEEAADAAEDAPPAVSWKATWRVDLFQSRCAIDLIK
jgi:hypothetical protein